MTQPEKLHWTLQDVDDFAARAHAGQTRNTGDTSAPDVPYIVHPRAVRDVLRSMLGICSVYYVLEIFRIYVDFESKTAVLIDV